MPNDKRMSRKQEMIPARLVFTAHGDSLVTHKDCWDSEEVSAIAYEGAPGATCDVCGEVIE